jgi:hypothetical protein
MIALLLGASSDQIGHDREEDPLPPSLLSSGAETIPKR